MALFQERESRDELGLGSIRDSIADHIFPGTSTIQTRLRYMLFIHWLFQMLEGGTQTPAQLAVEARWLENHLGIALKTGGRPMASSAAKPSPPPGRRRGRAGRRLAVSNRDVPLDPREEKGRPANGARAA